MLASCQIIERNERNKHFCLQLICQNMKSLICKGQSANATTALLTTVASKSVETYHLTDSVLDGALILECCHKSNGKMGHKLKLWFDQGFGCGLPAAGHAGGTDSLHMVWL